MLLGICADTATVLQVSENVGDWLGLGPDGVLGRPLETVAGAAAAEAIRAGGTSALRLIGPGGRALDGSVHRSEGLAILELEAAAADPDARLPDTLMAALTRMQETPTVQGLADALAGEVRGLTGFDRVMVYRFEPDWTGVVIAESADAGGPSYRGLHFPAGDIPPQARRLYALNLLRLIPDRGYRPARLIPAENPRTGRPTDLSGSVLRSVSPVHLEYMANMGVSASMSISLLCCGRLWGLIACHHRTPRRVPAPVRTTCELLGRMAGILLSGKDESEDAGRRLRAGQALAGVVQRMAGAEDFVQALAGADPGFAEAAGAAGAAVLRNGGVAAVGAAPPAEFVARLGEWLDGRGDEDVWATDRLAELWPPARDRPETAAGVLTARVSSEAGLRLIWFRPEVVATVTWGGDPAKPADVGPGGRISPRKSFEAWKQQVRGRSRPWEPHEIRAAHDLRRAVVRLVLRQAEELARLNEELRRSNAELDAFAYIAGHDLKEPLRGLQDYAGFLRRDYADRLDAAGVADLDVLVRLARRMDDLITNLLRYSRVGRLELDRRPTDLNAVLAEVLEMLRFRLDAAGARVEVPRPLPTAVCDPLRTGEVLHNLLSNAIKYNDRGDPRVEVGYRTAGGGEPVPPGATVFTVRDNGIGIPAEHRETVFRIFRRLHPQDRYGGGAGAGLTIARRIVERHGGRIWIDPAVAEGTCFCFTLEPAAADGACGSGARSNGVEGVLT